MLGVRAPSFLIGKVGTALGATALTAAGCCYSLFSRTLSPRLLDGRWCFIQIGRTGATHARHSRLASAKRSLAPVWIMALRRVWRRICFRPLDWNGSEQRPTTPYGPSSSGTEAVGAALSVFQSLPFNRDSWPLASTRTSGGALRARNGLLHVFCKAFGG
ncbi:hypothetical protein K456DRAFT_36131 [Colletotrichum gloeosporioides 23]|nr:hypothetical protein K456DRAFT_36131 [Colletotrichum gloeosporioides 23]